MILHQSRLLPLNGSNKKSPQALIYQCLGDFYILDSVEKDKFFKIALWKEIKM